MLVITSIILVMSFVGITIFINRELPESISSMVYVLPCGWRWLWTVWLWAIGLLIAAPLLDSLPEKYEIFGFLTIANLSFCGAIPLFVRDLNKMHNIFGISAGIFSQIDVAIINTEYLFLWIFMLSALWLNDKAVFIAEAICFITLVCCIK